MRSSTGRSFSRETVVLSLVPITMPVSVRGPKGTFTRTPAHSAMPSGTS